MEKMTLIQFGTDTYGAQLSLACDLVEKTIYFRVLSLFNGKKNVEDFTDFATAVDAYNAFVAGTRLTEYGEKVRDDFLPNVRSMLKRILKSFPVWIQQSVFPFVVSMKLLKMLRM